jgi:hypothetical protein
VVVPSRHQSGNVATVVGGVAQALAGVATWEIVFVDDSDDSTPDAVIAAGRGRMYA